MSKLADFECYNINMIIIIFLLLLLLEASLSSTNLAFKNTFAAGSSVKSARRALPTTNTNTSIEWCPEGTLASPTCTVCASAELFCRRGALFAVPLRAVVAAVGFAAHNAQGDALTNELWLYRESPLSPVPPDLNPVRVLQLRAGPALVYARDEHNLGYMFDVFDDLLLTAIAVVSTVAAATLLACVGAWRCPRALRQLDLLSWFRSVDLRRRAVLRSRSALGGALTVALGTSALGVGVFFALRWALSIETDYTAVLDTAGQFVTDTDLASAMPRPTFALRFVAPRQRCAALCASLRVAAHGCAGHACALHHATCGSWLAANATQAQNASTSAAVANARDAACEWRAVVSDMQFGDQVLLDAHVPNGSVVGVQMSALELSFVASELSNATLLWLAPVGRLLGGERRSQSTVSGAFRMLAVRVDNRLEPRLSGVGRHVQINAADSAWPLPSNASSSPGLSVRLSYSSETPAWQVTHKHEYSLVETAIAMQALGIGLVWGVGRAIFSALRTLRLQWKGRKERRRSYRAINDSDNTNNDSASSTNEERDELLSRV